MRDFSNFVSRSATFEAFNTLKHRSTARAGTSWAMTAYEAKANALRQRETAKARGVTNPAS
jgi:hypothetical protein